MNNEATNTQVETARRRWMPWVAGGAALAVLAGGVGAWAWNSNQDAQALKAFQEAQAAAITACTPQHTNDLDELLTSAENIKDGAELAQAITQAQAALHKVTETEPPTDRAERLTQAEKLNAQADECTNTHVTLTEAITALTGALTEHARTTYDAAVKAANDLITNGQTVINNSENKVADNQIRLDAQAALDQLKTTTSKTLPEDADWKTINTHTADVNTHLKAATDALKAVTDAQGAWEQAQGQATAANSGTGSAWTPTNNNGGWTNNTGTGNTGTGNTGTTSTNTGSSSGMPQNLGESGHWYNHDFPEYMYDEDGHRHHQIQPDSNGSWTDYGTPIN